MVISAGTGLVQLVGHRTNGVRLKIASIGRPKCSAMRSASSRLGLYSPRSRYPIV